MGRKLDTTERRLSDVAIRNAKPKDFPLADGGGLRLHRTPAGTLIWQWTYKNALHPTGSIYSIGSYPQWTLAQARDERDAIRKLRDAGTDPNEDKRGREAAAVATKRAKDQAERDAVENTLERIAREVHAKRKKVKNARYRAEWIGCLERYVFPKLGGRQFPDISAVDLLGILQPLADRVPETASRVRWRLEAIWDRAIFLGLAQVNPARVIRDELEYERTEQHLRALDYREVPALVAKLRAFDGAYDITKLAAEFAVLTASRTSEVLNARWSEIDSESHEWVIPPARMKMRREHRVPLAPRAVEILEQAAPYGDGGLIFPSIDDPRRSASNMLFAQLLKRLKTGRKRADGEDESYADRTTMHGACRSTFSTWSREKTTVHHAVIEAALAHRNPDKTERSYDRSEYKAERRALAEMWASYCTTPTPPANVVSIRQRGRR